MKLILSPEQQRVLGALLEKQMSTPEHYPLSLNALMNACNQKSNRDPVYSWDEAQLQKHVNALLDKKLIVRKEERGSRVPKFAQRLAGGEFSEMELSQAEMAVLCELLLRGAQTAGELRTRCQRLHSFDSLAELETVLSSLCQESRGPLLTQLAKEPGKREARYQHLLQTFDVLTAASSSVQPTRTAQAGEDTLSLRVDALERRIDELEAKLQQLLTS